MSNPFRSYRTCFTGQYLISALESSAVARLDAAPIASINGHKIGNLTLTEATAMLDPFQRPELDRRYTRNLGTRAIAMLLRLNGF